MIRINANLGHYNQITITDTSDSTPEQNSQAMELINKKKIDVKSLITDYFSFDDYFEALEKAKSGKAMKVIIRC